MNFMKDIIPLSFFLSSFIIICFVCECLLFSILKKKMKKKLKIFHPNDAYKLIFLCCLIFHIYCIMYEKELYVSEALYLVYAVCSACVYIFFRQRDYSKAEINMSLKDTESIGALWAHQTYDAYYKKILENILERMNKFEEKHNVQFFTKKLLLVIPLSNDIEGTFSERDSSIEEFGNLEIVENDAGGNMNRMFKNPVFKVQDGYVVAEFSQPVSAIRRSRFILKEKEKSNYIRDCFIKTLKLLLKGSPCTLVLHDDINGSESLSRCMLSTIENERRPAGFTV